jgi:hypothetical protein
VLPLAPMRAPSPLLVAALGIGLLQAPVGAQQQLQPPEPVPVGPPTDTTEVKGTLPFDLRGVWLLVAHGEMLTPGKFRNVVQLWSGEGEGEAFAFKLVHRELPAAIQGEIDEANRQLKPWNPSAEQLEELRRRLDRLEEADPWRFTRHDVTFFAPDHYAETGLRDEVALLEGSAFTIKVRHVYRPQPPGKGAQLMSDDAVYAVRATDTTVVQGDQNRVMLAAGFAPIPVAMKGPFWLHRLRAPGETGASGAGGWLLAAWEALTRGCR